MSATTITCPAWCTRHPENETETHQSAGWRGYGLAVMIEQADGDDLSIEVDKVGGSEYLSLTAGQAHELGMELVRAAARVRAEVRSTR